MTNLSKSMKLGVLLSWCCCNQLLTTKSVAENSCLLSYRSLVKKSDTGLTRRKQRAGKAAWLPSGCSRVCFLSVSRLKKLLTRLGSGSLPPSSEAATQDRAHHLASIRLDRLHSRTPEPPLPPPSSTRKDACDYIGHTWASPEPHPNLRSADQHLPIVLTTLIPPVHIS